MDPRQRLEALRKKKRLSELRTKRGMAPVAPVAAATPQPQGSVMNDIGSLLQGAGHVASSVVSAPLAAMDNIVGKVEDAFGFKIPGKMQRGEIGIPAIPAPTDGMGAKVLSGVADLAGTVGKGYKAVAGDSQLAQDVGSTALDVAALAGTRVPVQQQIAAANTAKAGRAADVASNKIMGARTLEEKAELGGIKLRAHDLQTQKQTPTKGQKLGQFVGGADDLKRDFTMHNLDRGEDMVRQSLGRDGFADADLDAFEAPHAASMKAVDDMPEVAFDDTFMKQLGDAGQTESLLKGLTPQEIATIRADLMNANGGTGAQLRATSSDLRAKARDNLAKAEGEQATPRARELGDAQIEMAHALDDQIARRLAPDQVDNYNAGRRGFAISNAVRRARKGDRIDPRVISREGKINRGMDGELRLLAELTEAYPDVFGKVPEPKGNGIQGALARVAGAGIAGSFAGAGTGAMLAGGTMAAAEGVPAIVRSIMGRGGNTGNIRAGAPDLFKRREYQAPAADMPPKPGPGDMSGPDGITMPNPSAPSGLSLAPDGPLPTTPPGSGEFSFADVLADPRPELPPRQAQVARGPEDMLLDRLPQENLPQFPQPGMVADDITAAAQNFDTPQGLRPGEAPVALEPAPAAPSLGANEPFNFADLLDQDGALAPEQFRPQGDDVLPFRQSAGRELDTVDYAPPPGDVMPWEPQIGEMPWEQQLTKQEAMPWEFQSDDLALADQPELPRGDPDFLDLVDTPTKPGAKMVTSPGGYLSYTEANGRRTLDRAFVAKAARGKGEGKSNLLEAATKSADEGVPLDSDKHVKNAQLHVYDSLRKAGKLDFEVDEAAFKKALKDGTDLKGDAPMFTNIRPAGSFADELE